jgi:hypothetical protein
MTQQLPQPNGITGQTAFRRHGRYMAALIGAYIGYGLLLGPFWAVDGRYGVASDAIRKMVWAPVLWTRDVPLADHILDAYLDTWYADPNASETTK